MDSGRNRVRATTNGDVDGTFGLPPENYELGVEVPAVDTGTLNCSASLLI